MTKEIDPTTIGSLVKKSEDGRTELLLLQGALYAMPPEQQARVESLCAQILAITESHGDDGQFALILASCRNLVDRE